MAHQRPERGPGSGGAENPCADARPVRGVGPALTEGGRQSYERPVQGCLPTGGAFLVTCSGEYHRRERRAQAGPRQTAGRHLSCLHPGGVCPSSPHLRRSVSGSGARLPGTAQPHRPFDQGRVLDLYSRRVVDWSRTPNLNASSRIAALPWRCARASRGCPPPCARISGASSPAPQIIDCREGHGVVATPGCGVPSAWRCASDVRIVGARSMLVGWRCAPSLPRHKRLAPSM